MTVSSPSTLISLTPLPRVVSRFHLGARLLAVVGIVLGALAFLGWMLNSMPLRSLLSGDITMKTNPAIGLIAMGLSLLLSTVFSPRFHPFCRGASIALAVFAFAMGFATLLEYATGRDFGIDQLLFTEEPHSPATFSPNRMGLPAASSLTLLGLAIVLLDATVGRVRPSQWLAIVIALVALVPLIGYAYSIETLYGGKGTGIAAQTAIGIAALAMGILFARPQWGIMAIVVAEGPGGVLARHMLLPSIVIPIFLGWLRTLAERHDILGPAFGRTFLIMSIILIFTWLIWWSAHILARVGHERLEALNALMRAKSEAEAARASAEAANAAKDQFLAVLSHELRTPLTPVMTLVQLMETDGSLPQGAQESLRTIRRNVELEARIIDDLLDLTRITHGKLTLRTETVDLHDLLRHVITMCRPDTQAKGLRLEVHLAPTRFVTQGDPARLQQVFWNLLKNSIKFTPSGGSVVVRTDASTGGGFRLIITDSGVGIEPDALPRIFNAFEQGDAAVARQFGGLGLGLAISKAIVQMHGGMIDVKSGGRGAGATAELTLPAKAAPAEASAPRPIATGSMADLQNLRVLLVEDNIDTARALTRLLTVFGCQVTNAHTIATALAAFSAGTFDLLLSDLGLPDGTGHDLLRKIRETSEIKAIAISGFGMELDVRKSLDAGFTAHLTKPVDIQQLQKTLLAAISSRKPSLVP